MPRFLASLATGSPLRLRSLKDITIVKGGLRTVKEGRTRASFYLKDETDHCLVIPGKNEFIRAGRKRWQGNTYIDRDSANFDRLHGSYRFTERIIYKDTPLYALGIFKAVSVNNVKMHTLSEPDNRSQEMVLGRGKEHVLIDYLNDKSRGAMFFLFHALLDSSYPAY